MSEHAQFLMEKQKLDEFVARHFRIVGVKEDLSGAWLDFQHPGGETATLHLTMANSRKYYVTLLMAQAALPN